MFTCEQKPISTVAEECYDFLWICASPRWQLSCLAQLLVLKLIQSLLILLMSR